MQELQEYTLYKDRSIRTSTIRIYTLRTQQLQKNIQAFKDRSLQDCVSSRYKMILKKIKSFRSIKPLGNISKGSTSRRK